MKKIKRKSNPKITESEEINDHMKKLLEKYVVCYIFEDYNNEYFSELHGFLDRRIRTVYFFKFNPLNQWRYQKVNQTKEKIKPIPRTSSHIEYSDLPREYDHELLINDEFENSESTYEFKFTIADIDYVDDNKIYFFPNFHTHLTQI